jgi:hypothetical protein
MIMLSGLQRFCESSIDQDVVGDRFMIWNLFFQDIGIRFTGVLDNAISGLLVSAVWAGLLYLYFTVKDLI